MKTHHPFLLHNFALCFCQLLALCCSLECLSPSDRVRASWPPRRRFAHRTTLSASCSKNGEDEALGSKRGLCLEIEVHSSLSSIPSTAWDDCLTKSSSPFLCHSWIRCLEETNCACPDTGWTPHHLSLKLGGHPVGYVPLYIKDHSMGEFIFDQQFAEASYRIGAEYYPKLLVAIPFTPVSGNRVLWHPERVLKQYSRKQMRQLNRQVAHFLKVFAATRSLSSVHINFLTEDEADDISPIQNSISENTSASAGVSESIRLLFRNFEDWYLRRTTIQYHWSNRDSDGKPFQSFDHYLETFRSKKRIKIRRERRKVLEDEGVRIDFIEGKEILQHDGLVKRMFDIYVSTIDRLFWGRQYLNIEFFEQLASSDFIDNLVFVCARRHKAGERFCVEDVFAGTFNVVKDGVFYGRYWGCLPGKEVKNLHFECCYWSAIEYCIKNRLRRMEPGAGGRDYKWARGFNPVPIHSVHFFTNRNLRRAIGQFFLDETKRNFETAKYLRRRSATTANLPTEN